MLKWLLLLILSYTSTISESFNLSSFRYFREKRDQADSKISHITSLLGISAKGDKLSINEEGTFLIPAETYFTLYLFGVETKNITFTKSHAKKGESCDAMDHTIMFPSTYVSEGISVAEVILPPHNGYYYICLQNNGQWYHQGSTSWIKIKIKNKLLPVSIQALLIFVLLALSGLFSGLNLGLMALDKNELQVIARCGDTLEKRYAKAISPVRKRGNYLLCSLLLGNVLVNSTLTILLDDLTSGLVAIIGSTLGIVIFGEIIPQAACSRHGLAVGAKTICLTYLFMAITFPLSYPISKILDKLLGDEIGNVYDREKLMEFIKITKTYNKLEEDEMNIISGALELKTKTVGEVMTRIEDVFMLPINATLDFDTVSEITKKGYSRIPIYEDERKNIIALLHTKDLTFIDPDDKTPLKTVIDFYKHPLIHTFEDETLNNVLNHFKLGKSHMALVKKIYDNDETDPYYEITGIVTLEDVIEEILQIEIVDETDILTDNRKKQRRKGAQIRQDFSDFARMGSSEQGTHVISSQLALATFQYLSTTVPPFKKPHISESVLRQLVSQKLYFYHTTSNEEKYLYKTGITADYFIMILEGKAKVTLGSENLVFDAGPFSYFGIPALKVQDAKTTPPLTPDSPIYDGKGTENPFKSSLSTLAPGTFVPDYTLQVSGPTLYMKITSKVYLRAFNASKTTRLKDESSEDDKIRETVSLSNVSDEKKSLLGKEERKRNVQIDFKSNDSKEAKSTSNTPLTKSISGSTDKKKSSQSSFHVNMKEDNDSNMSNEIDD